MIRKFQVFISSTYTDLLEERQAAVSAVLKAGHIPAGMELFTAGDRSQLTTIKKWIDESDIYMLILGGRYGSVEADTGLSYTEIEFDYAVSKGIPLFSVVINPEHLEEKVKLNGTSVFEKENQAKLNDFRKKVLGYMSSFFSDIKDIKLAVHESLNELSRRKGLIGWIPATSIGDQDKLKDEIENLQSQIITLQKAKQENEKLKKTISDLSTKSNTSQIDEVIDKLSKITIDVPKDFTATKTIEKYKLSYLLFLYREEFANGIIESHDSSQFSTFLYRVLSARLLMYDLIDEFIPKNRSYTIRRLSRRGLDLVAHLEQTKIENIR